MGIDFNRKSSCILIPAHCEEAVIAETVNSALAQGRDVYVANDASTDRTSEIAKGLGAIVHDCPVNLGKAMALRDTIHRFKLAEKYDAVYILDADTILEPGHVAALEAEFRRGKHDGDGKTRTAYLVGRIESRPGTTFFQRYRMYVMWLYNHVIRRPQGLLDTVNVLPGSSVLLSSYVVERIDWQNVARYALDDYEILRQIRANRWGAVQYVHGTPRALVLEPATFREYLKQTRRWFSGIAQTHWQEKLYRDGSRWGVWNNAHLFSWAWSALAPLLLLPLAYLIWQTPVWWAVLVAVLLGVTQQSILGIMHVAAGPRHNWATLPLMPLFYAVSYFESWHFLLCFAGFFKPKQGAAWDSPERVVTVAANDINGIEAKGGV